DFVVHGGPPRVPGGQNPPPGAVLKPPGKHAFAAANKKKMPAPPSTSSATADREFVHSRLIDAPWEVVFEAFANPAHLARWWGPAGFSSSFDVFDVRPGGAWRFVMHGPDGTDYPNESVFLEVVPPERVVFEHISEGHHFFMTITFSPQGDRTLVGWRQVFDTAEHRERIAPYVIPANEQNLDRLAAEVSRTPGRCAPDPPHADPSSARPPPTIPLPLDASDIA